MASAWACLEGIRGLVGVPAEWGRALGDSFGGFRGAFLRERRELARSYPCAVGCGRMREVVGHGDGSFVALCTCEPARGEDFALAREDLVLLELDLGRLGRALCRALGCDARPNDLGVPGARQIGAFSAAAVPVVLSIQDEREGFREAVAGVIAAIGKPFILLAPTSGFVDGAVLGRLKGAGAALFDLESHVVLLPSGKLQAKKNPMELFAAFLPGASGPAPEEVARQVFAMVKALDTERVVRKAPVLTVFRLYFAEGLSRAEVAKRCGCVASLITDRLKQIERRLGKTRDQLRVISPQFEKIEDSLSDSRARRIYRKVAAYGDSEDGDEED